MKYKLILALALAVGSLLYDVAMKPIDPKDLIYKGVFFFLFALMLMSILPCRWLGKRSR